MCIETLKSQMRMSLKMIKRKNESLYERLSGTVAGNNNSNNNNNNNDSCSKPRRQHCWRSRRSSDCCCSSSSSSSSRTRSNSSSTSSTALLKCLSSPCATFSVKFGRKVQYVNYLHELEPHMDLERLPIPKQVVE